ncbi:hypothetical protein A2482_02120 [Candidatus Falkowbacteria bacterium RIFOXYC2_FULL_48_21]|uniref:N-acetyltransferase domain-containing protein n=1 Tax=Candidatus Falkowbacteria bacterium RIFOXYC2_FULL_48_21 TaxID=1798005 RepID=A0A1F5T6D0_9BACT|nr:MAG: hypothetical protein A2482_02120 [Candidatus Falkowbacteria bacterium RIFOXYC2_FULL_48_21]
MKNEKIKFDKATERKTPRAERAREFQYREVLPDDFIKQRDQLPLSLLAFLTPHTAEDYRKQKTTLFLSEDNHCGFGLTPDGNLISVFSLEKERGPALVKEALARGAKSLSCVGQKLRELYEEAGFQVKKEEAWNQNYAPEYWDYDRFGTPDYYEMKLLKEAKD